MSEDSEGRPERKPFYGVLIALGLAVVAVIVVIVASIVRPQQGITVAELAQPAVAGLGAGSEVYPENSAEGISELVKFGYLPAVDVTLLDDGTLVLADEETAGEAMGLDGGVESLSADEFLAGSISPAPGREDFGAGTPVTWDQALEAYGGSTVFLPEVASGEELDPLLAEADERGAVESLIVRSESLEVLTQAVDAGAAAMYTGTEATLGAVVDAGVGMATLPADSPLLDEWMAADLDIWVTDLESEEDFAAVAERGAFGALAENPFALKPVAE